MTRMLIKDTQKKSRIAPEIYGHFSEHLGRCVYEGLYVGEDSGIKNVRGMRTDVVEALKELKIPVLRWPGGCFADEYHWMDGIGAKNTRKKMINTHWGGVLEDNTFGTHEFFELCDQLGCKAYITANMGSATVKELADWVEYMTFPGISPMSDLRKINGHEQPWNLDYLGIGNENWGCGGHMRPQYYADEYRRYQTFARQYNKNRLISKICCGPNVDDYNWTRIVLETCFDHSESARHGYMDGLSLHYYTLPEVEDDWEKKGSATVFTKDIFYQTLKRAMFMEELIVNHGKIMDEYDPNKQIGLVVDEWGVWTDVESGTNPGFLFQQNTIRDALVAAITLNIFNRHSDRVKMACLAQVANVLQSVVFTNKEKMIKTPTYHVFHMYRHHQGACLLDAELSEETSVGNGANTLPALSQSVSVDKKDILTVTLTNHSLEEDLHLILTLESGRRPALIEASVLSGVMNAHNTFDDPERVLERPFFSVQNSGSGLCLTVPRSGIVSLRIDGT